MKTMRIIKEDALFALTASLVLVWNVGSYTLDHNPRTAAPASEYQVVLVEAPRIEFDDLQYAETVAPGAERKARALCRRTLDSTWSPGNARDMRECVVATADAQPEAVILS